MNETLCPICGSTMHDGLPPRGCPAEADCPTCGHPLHDESCAEAGCNCEERSELS